MSSLFDHGDKLLREMGWVDGDEEETFVINGIGFKGMVGVPYETEVRWVGSGGRPAGGTAVVPARDIVIEARGVLPGAITGRHAEQFTAALPGSMSTMDQCRLWRIFVHQVMHAPEVAWMCLSSYIENFMGGPHGVNPDGLSHLDVDTVDTGVYEIRGLRYFTAQTRVYLETMPNDRRIYLNRHGFTTVKSGHIGNDRLFTYEDAGLDQFMFAMLEMHASVERIRVGKLRTRPTEWVAWREPEKFLELYWRDHGHRHKEASPTHTEERPAVSDERGAGSASVP